MRETIRNLDKEAPPVYFPFVAGDLIEKHRRVLGETLKSDLQNYLDHTKNSSKKSTINNDRLRSSAAYSNRPPSDSVFQKKDVGLNSSFGHSRPTFKIKELFDSEYVRPNENERVF